MPSVFANGTVLGMTRPWLWRDAHQVCFECGHVQLNIGSSIVQRAWIVFTLPAYQPAQPRFISADKTVLYLDIH
eukprot:scaffold121072_cov22-Prasinocladus_malaysianus.AAC.1